MRMRAIAVTAAGQRPALVELPRPEAVGADVLVRVRAASINPVDLAIASGRLKHGLEYRYPVVLGRDFAGEIVEVGAEVSRFVPGDEVFGFVPIASPTIRAGAFAEYVAVAENAAITVKPPELSDLIAACLPLAGTAALMAVEFSRPEPGAVLLIAGATGGVGRYATALAASHGAHVIATGLPVDAEDLIELGASEVADYTGDVASVIRARHPDGIDGLIHLIAPPQCAALASLVRAGGTVATTVHAADVAGLQQRGVAAINLLAATEPMLAERLAAYAVEGTLRPMIEHVYELSGVMDGLEEIGRGHARGKLAVSIAEPGRRDKPQ